MLILLSPAKSLDFESPLPPLPPSASSQPDFLDASETLIGVLRHLSPADIGRLMGISDALAVLNAGRFSAWSRPFTPANARPAALAFNGDVYEGLAAATLSPGDLAFAQTQLRILSGLYGVLRPLDLIQPYRLEMGTKLANPGGKDLYAFWGDRPAAALNRALAETGSSEIVNLASEEYFKVVARQSLAAPVIQPVFEDWSSGRYKVVSFYAKRARGLMARFAVQGRLTSAGALKDFAVEGYRFADEASDAQRWVFRRKAE